MWDFKLGHLTFGERTDILFGKNVCPFYWFCRLCWLAFALWTMSVPGTDAHVTPAIWLMLVAIYYYYPS